MLDVKKFLSVAAIGGKIREALYRFPVVFGDAVVGTGLALYLVDNEDQKIIAKILIMTVIGFFVFLASDIYSERKGVKKIYGEILVFVILAIYYAYLPKDPETFQEIHIIRTFLLVFSSIIGIMVAPYLGRGEIIGFWQYNKKLFLRLAFTAVSSGTLFLGIAASLASFDFLFNLNIDGQWYLRVWITIVGLVSTTVFASGIPRNFGELEGESDYPKVIKVFSQFVLVPLVGLYVAILYLYAGKIIITQEWPEGMVSYLVLIFSTVGIAVNLLLYPERETSVWIKNFSKAFWIILVPLTALMFGAVWVRVADYGLTHERLFVIILGLWLLGLSGYFHFKKLPDIKIIFLSLVGLIILCVFGPVNVFSVSKASQIGRLEKILTADKILINGKIQKVDSGTVPKEDVRQISSIIYYLGKIDRTKDIQGWFGDDISMIDKYTFNSSALEAMGLKYMSQPERPDVVGSTEDSRYYYLEGRDSFNISGFNYLANFALYWSGEGLSANSADFTANEKEKRFAELDQNKFRLVEKFGTDNRKTILEFDLDQFINKLAEDFDATNSDIPDERMTLETDGGKVYFSTLILEKNNGRWEIRELVGTLLYN